LRYLYTAKACCSIHRPT